MADYGCCSILLLSWPVLSSDLYMNLTYKLFSINFIVMVFSTEDAELLNISTLKDSSLQIRRCVYHMCTKSKFVSDVIMAWTLKMG